jgi:hypothetical protein
MAEYPNRRAGTLFLKVDGVIHQAKGNFTYDLGAPKRDAIVGADNVHGYKEAPKVPFIEGAITDRGDLDLEKLFLLDGALVTLELGNGKTIALSDAWFAGEGTASTEEAEVPVRFEGKRAVEV